MWTSFLNPNQSHQTTRRNLTAVWHINGDVWFHWRVANFEHTQNQAVQHVHLTNIPVWFGLLGDIKNGHTRDWMDRSRRLTLFGHIMRMDDNADAKRILLASPPVDWRKQPGRPRITWLSSVQQDLRHHHLMLPEAADLAQNRSLWRMVLSNPRVTMPETTTTMTKRIKMPKQTQMTF